MKGDPCNEWLITNAINIDNGELISIAFLLLSCCMVIFSFSLSFFVKEDRFLWGFL